MSISSHRAEMQTISVQLISAVSQPGEGFYRSCSWQTAASVDRDTEQVEWEVRGSRLAESMDGLFLWLYSWDNVGCWMLLVSYLCGSVISTFRPSTEKPSKALNLPISLYSNPHLWSYNWGNEQKNDIKVTSTWNEFPSQGIWAQP